MKTYIIVGGSRGIGRAITENLLEQHQVINLSRSKPNFEHANLSHHQVDILIDELPDIEQADGLIYCPGSINLNPISRLKLDDFRADFEINVIGAVKAIQKYQAIIKKGDKPAMLFFSTVAAKLGMPFHASVAAAKSAVEGLVKSVGAELAPTVRVNAIAPTVTDTELASNLLRSEKMIENITARHPLKKYLNTTEVASMASFLLSDQAASISGQIFEMDCGIVSFKI